MKKSRAKTQNTLQKTQEKYDGLASEITQLESKLQKRYQKRCKLEARVDKLLELAYPGSEAGGQGLQHAISGRSPALGNL